MIMILDGAAEVTEEYVGIIYSVDDKTEAILHKIGNWHAIEAFYQENKSEYKAIETLLADTNARYYLLKLPASNTEVSGLHNTSRLEGFLIRNNIHPLGRVKRLGKLI